MAFWWVNHRQTHREELEGGYIWSPKHNKNGARNVTYLNLTKARPADLIFSYAMGHIGAVGVVENAYRQCDRPLAFGKTGEQWDKDGWLVPVDWSVLNSPIVPNLHLDAIRPLLPMKNSPIRANGKGNQSCYLAQISDALGELLLQLAQATNPGLRDSLDDAGQAVQEAREESRLAQAQIPETEKAQLMKARRGQGLFRLRVEAIESACRLTHTTDKRFLVASHIKPWRFSDHTEKLDGHNGLLLAPHVDRLFDKGWISFSDDGAILCAGEEIKSLMTQWGLDPETNVGPFNGKQRQYLAFHRIHIYKAELPTESMRSSEQPMPKLFAGVPTV
jgi:putative restriction endonuclease